MNERINELALEAKLRPAILLYYYRTIHGLTDTEQEELEQMEKFAELIVKECAALVKGQPHVDKMMDCNSVIKQHFGVEE